MTQVTGAPGGPPGRVRVLLLVDGLGQAMGGAERTVLTMATRLPADRYEVWVCTSRYADGPPLRLLDEAGVRHLHLGRARTWEPRALLRLWRTLRDDRIDVVHSHMFGSNVWGALLGRLAGVPAVVAHEHSWSYEGEPVRRILDMVIGRLADAFVAVSQADARLMRSVEKVPEDRIHVIPSAWVPRSNGRPAADVRSEFGIPAGAPVIGTVAILRRVKRLELLVEAFATVLEGAPDAWLLIAGEGPDRPAIESAVDRFGVGERTVLTGLRADVENIWRTIDVAAMSSDREGTPVAALEAMAHGVPMVAPDVGGIPDVFDGTAGVLVPRHDAGALGCELLALVRDADRRAIVGAAGRERSAEFTIDRQIERFCALYDELLAAPRSRRRLRRRDRRRSRGTA